MSNQLLPCPYCGDTQLSSVDMVYLHKSGPVKGLRIKCGTCGAQAPDTCWNHRATQPAAGQPVAYKLVAVQANGEWREVRGKWVDGAPIAEMLEGIEEGYLRVELAFSAPPAAAHGGGRSDADYAIEHGRYLANDADKFMKALNDAFDPETEETDLNDESISEARKRLASSVYEFRKRADHAMRTKGAAAHGDEAVEVLGELVNEGMFPGSAARMLTFVTAISRERQDEILRTMKGPIRLVAIRAQGDGEKNNG